MTANEARAQIEDGQRFAFGENWRQFLDLLDKDRIVAAERSLQTRLGELDGLRFVDVGSGSGLFSLAARRLGAHVVSFDFDPESVACTAELRSRMPGGDSEWKVLAGSALDRPFLRSIGEFDVVYSRGVLHHTGDMWAALENVAALIAPGDDCSSPSTMTRGGPAVTGVGSTAIQRIRPASSEGSCSRQPTQGSGGPT